MSVHLLLCLVVLDAIADAADAVVSKAVYLALAAEDDVYCFCEADAACDAPTLLLRCCCLFC